jgi:hypothetical protein
MLNSFVKINKNKARRLFNKGITIFLLPCNVRINNVWMIPLEINNKEINEFINIDITYFDSIVNNFEYYNCNSELGNYTHFYIKEG